MTATIGNTPFELVDESAPATYKGRERRRIRPTVAVSDSLAEARKAAWITSVTRVVLVVTLWTALVAPHLMAPDLVVLRTGTPLAYVLAEVSGLAVVLRFIVKLARAATRY